MIMASTLCKEKYLCAFLAHNNCVPFLACYLLWKLNCNLLKLQEDLIIVGTSPWISDHKNCVEHRNCCIERTQIIERIKKNITWRQNDQQWNIKKQ